MLEAWIYFWICPEPTLESVVNELEEGESSTFDKSAVLTLLYWGFKGPTSTYGCVSYSIHKMLDDPHVGGVWYSKPHVTTSFVKSGKVVEINGMFRHRSCTKVDNLGEGFINLCCSMCSTIPLENDFQKRAQREDHSIEKGD